MHRFNSHQLFFSIVQTSVTFSRSIDYNRFHSIDRWLILFACQDRSRKEKATPRFLKHQLLYVSVSLNPPSLPLRQPTISYRGNRASCYLETSSADLDSSPPCNLAALYHHVSFTFLMPRDITHFILQRCKLRRTHPAPGRNKFACIYVVTASRILRFTQPRILE